MSNGTNNLTSSQKYAMELTLQDIRTTFGNRPALSLDAVAKYLHRDRRSLLADDTFPILYIGSKRGRYHYAVTPSALAVWMHENRKRGE